MIANAISDENFYSALSTGEDFTVESDSPLAIKSHSSQKLMDGRLGIIRFVSVILLVCFIGTYYQYLDYKSSAILIVSVLFTWFHIWLALWMCFYPLSFVGIGVLGWQGIVPRKASKMANKSCDLMVDRLIIVNELIDRIDGAELHSFLSVQGHTILIENEVNEVLRKTLLGVSYLPSNIQTKLLTRTSAVGRQVCVDFVASLKTKLKDRKFFNVRDLIVTEFVKDKALLVRLFTQTGHDELRFIEGSGAVMGFLCGLVQIALWRWFSLAGYNPYVLFGTVGLIIGYATNWVALYVIFNPVDPVHVSFPFRKRRRVVTFQGLFLQRQKEASGVYAKIVTDSVLNAHAVIENLKQNGKWDQVKNLFSETVTNSVLRTLPNIPYFSYDSLVDLILQRLETHVVSSPALIASVVTYMQLRLQLRETIQRKLELLPPSEFEQMLHPVFEEDEFLLILLGAFLGALVGVLQVFLFHL